MERLLFSPCTRLHDLLESQGEEARDHDHELFQERNLNVSTEEFLSAESAFTYADLHDTLGDEYTDTVSWLTPHAAVAREYGLGTAAWNQLYGSCSFTFHANGKDLIAFGRSTEYLLEICDVILRLLAVSEVHRVTISKRSSPDNVLINAPSLEGLMEQCQSLKALTLNRIEMDENHCRVLGAYSRPDLEIVLDGCEIASAGASTLVEVLGRNQGPTKLDSCKIDILVLADGLRGNSRLKSLATRTSDNIEVGNREVLAIAGALRENKGLVDLNLRCWGIRVSDETWDAVCDSLKTHPTLEVLDLRTAKITPTVLKSWIQALVDMLKVNVSIHTIHLDYRCSEHELYRGSVIPHLETNRFRPRLLAIQRTRPIPYRAKVLGRALLSARTDANRFWMLLSRNAEVAFPSNTTTIAAAANPPTPATAAATSAANVADVAASAMHTFTTAAIGRLPMATSDGTAATSATTPSTASASDAFAPTVDVAAATVTTPFAGQKRKARP
jgi:hypothetical protein